MKASVNNSEPADKSVEPTDESGSVTLATTSMSPTPTSTPWQAIFAPQYNAYYFYNTETQQTTWENPLLSSVSSSSSQTPTDSGSADTADPASTPYTSPQAALQAAALAAGIDPSLAHLDPTLLSSIPSIPSASCSTGIPPAFTVKFNARTGQSTRRAPIGARTCSPHERVLLRRWRMGEPARSAGWKYQRRRRGRQEAEDAKQKRSSTFRSAVIVAL